jgi:hypothetical protein
VNKIVPGIVIEAEDMTIQGMTGGSWFKNFMQPWEVLGRLWSDHYALIWFNGEVEDALTLGFEVPDSGPYCVYGYFSRESYGGHFAVSIGSRPAVTTIDLLDPHAVVPTEEIFLGQFTLSAGPHQLRLDALPAASSGGVCPQCSWAGIDCLALLQVNQPIVIDMRLEQGALHWSGDAMRVDLVSGDLGTLRSTAGNFAQSTTGCIAADAESRTIPLPSHSLAPGQGVWMLARGEHCVSGSFNEPGSGQVGNRDAEIAASGAACP